MTLRERVGDQALPLDGAAEVSPEVIKRVKSYGYILVSAAIVNDLNARIELGVQRYGKKLETHNGRNAKQDLMDELLDSLHYSMQDYMESGDFRAKARFDKILELVFSLKSQMLGLKY